MTTGFVAFLWSESQEKIAQNGAEISSQIGKPFGNLDFCSGKKHVPICEGTAEKVEFISRVHIFSPPYPNPTNKMFSALLVIIPY